MVRVLSSAWNTNCHVTRSEKSNINNLTCEYHCVVCLFISFCVLFSADLRRLCDSLFECVCVFICVCLIHVRFISYSDIVLSQGTTRHEHTHKHTVIFESETFGKSMNQINMENVNG